MLTRLKYSLLKTVTPLRSFSVFHPRDNNHAALSQIMNTLAKLSNHKYPQPKPKEHWPNDLKYYKYLSASHEEHEQNILNLFAIIKADPSRSPMPNESERKMIQADLDIMAKIRYTMELLVQAARHEGMEFVKEENGVIKAVKIASHIISIPAPR